MAADCPRIGITMRETTAIGIPEVRDAIARDWADFLRQAVPEAIWMPIPNLGSAAVSHCTDWHLDGLILSGGDDIGATPRRDATERALIESFLELGKPVLGVCRGLQMLWTSAGGQLKKLDGHSGTRHPVTLTDPMWQTRFGPGPITVNSFHTNQLVGPTPVDWRCGAVDSKDRIEAIIHCTLPVIGVMWHPEREAAPAALDRAIIRSLFLRDGPSP